MRRIRCKIQNKNGIFFSMYISFLASIDGSFSYQNNDFVLVKSPQISLLLGTIGVKIYVGMPSEL